MSKIETNDEQLMALELSFMDLASRFASEGVSPMASAAIMIKLALMMYKSSLNAEQYNLMVDNISNSRDLIKSFDEYARMGRLN